MTTVGRTITFNVAPPAIAVSCSPPGSETAWDLAQRLGLGTDVDKLYPLVDLGLLESFIHLGNGKARLYRVTDERRLMVLSAAKKLQPRRPWAALAKDLPCSLFEPEPLPNRPLKNRKDIRK